MGLFNFRGKPKSLSPEKPLCVLHIDDSKWVRIPVAVVLRRHFGIRVLEAGSGPAGLEIAQAEKPDLIILDVMMPQMDGFDTLVQLQQNAGTKDIPVLMCTARDHTRDVNTALRLGAADYITKPIEEEALVAKVREILVSVNKWGKVKKIKPSESFLKWEEVLPPEEATEKKAEKPVSASASSSPQVRLCPLCHRKLDFIDQYKAWYCHPCRQYPDSK